MDADTQDQEEEEWLRAQGAAWTWFGWGCVVFGIAVVALFVLAILALFWDPIVLK